MKGPRVSARLLRVWLAATAVIIAARPVFAQVFSTPLITAPAEGQIVQGTVAVSGVTDMPDFASAELAFAYDPNPTGDWFTIQTASVPVTAGTVGTWDTTAITDGDYSLRLRVVLVDGSFHDASVKVKVRNYTPILVQTATPTATPTAALEIPTALIIAPSATPTEQIVVGPTATALPPNPAALSGSQILTGFWQGAAVLGLLVLGFGALIRLRR